MIPEELIKALSDATGIPSGHLQIRPLTHGGLINRSFKMTGPGEGRSWILQNINCSVFRETQHLNSNYLILYEFSIQYPGRIRIPAPLLFSEGQTLFHDFTGEVWRAMEWIEHSFTIEKVQTVEEARDVAVNFALFTRALSKDFPTNQLRPTLPRFHDLSFRSRQFEESVHNAPTERLSAAGYLVEELEKRNSYIRLFERFKNNPDDFPMRVMHHDAKISNILFDEKTGKAWGPIDLDTVMPGFYFSDLGDMIRSLAGSIDENASDLTAMQIREQVYEELVNSYSSIMENEWTAEEKKYKHAAGLLLVFMQTLRFLADYLNGNIYYQVTYMEQNLDRAKNQFRLLQCLEAHLEKKYQFRI
jgi:thiamine kinase-like enzyme